MLKLIKKYKPTSPGVRHKIDIRDKNLFLTKNYLNHIAYLKKLNVKNLAYKAGRNNSGKITMRFKGGRHKRSYRLSHLDFPFFNHSYHLLKNVYNPCSSNNLALLSHNSDNISYIKNINCFYNVNSDSIRFQFLNKIRVGSLVSNIELFPLSGIKFVKSAGSFAVVIKYDSINDRVLLRLPSKKLVWFNGQCLAIIGQNSNDFHNKKVIGKAGTNRWLGKRPRTRGTAMNAIDHPHGGNTRGTGKAFKNKWGNLAKWIKS